MSLEPVTNFKDSNGVDLGTKLVTKDYLISVYPEIGQQIGIPPELWTWGNGFQGRLGNASITDRSTPITTFAGGTNWKQVSAGSNYTAAIKTDGTLWMWGYNDTFGILGNNSTTPAVSTPITTFSGGTNWKQVSCGGYRTAAIKTDGTLWSWGQGSFGKLGNANTTDRSTPVTTFAGGNNWKQVSATGSHTAAIKTDGTLWVWGAGGFAQIGDNGFASKSTPVTTFAGGNNWKQVSTGYRHTAAIKTDGTLWMWGRSSEGQLGNAVVSGNISTPVTTFSGGTNWKQVSAGVNHTAAIKTDGTLWTWGSGSNGKLGNASTTDVSTPVTTFAGGTNWKQVSSVTTALSSGDHTTAIKTDGTLWTWGSGGNGRLGNASTTAVSTPVTTFAGGTNWKQVSAGNLHTAAIQSVDFASF